MTQVNDSRHSANDCPEEEVIAFDIHAKMPAAIENALAGFRRDLPELLKNKRNDRKWVAYNSRGERIGRIDRNPRRLYRECLHKHREGDFVVRCIFPEMTDIDCEELIGI
jgi:hypothetical protein